MASAKTSGKNGVATVRRVRPRRRYAIVRKPQLATGLEQVNGLVAEHRFFRFRTPLEVAETTRGGCFAHTARALDLASHGRTRNESWSALIALFENDWDEVAMAADTELDAGARGLKKALLRLVESVDEVR